MCHGCFVGRILRRTETPIRHPSSSRFLAALGTEIEIVRLEFFSHPLVFDQSPNDLLCYQETCGCGSQDPPWQCFSPRMKSSCHQAGDCRRDRGPNRGVCDVMTMEVDATTAGKEGEQEPPLRVAKSHQSSCEYRGLRCVAGGKRFIGVLRRCDEGAQ